jgi:GGDEF domain-containing protein
MGELTVRQRIASGPAIVDRQPVPMTVSIGVDALDSHRVAGTDDALRLADEALYSANNQDRNGVRPVQRA